MTETYSLSSDFGGDIASGQLADEIRNSSIVTNLLYINVSVSSSDNVDIVFQSTISGAEKITLDGLVVAHTPNPVTNYSITSEGYISFVSNLADNNAIRINANDPGGGINIDAGSGGITIDSDNIISIDAGALINITNTAGNIELDSAGLININSESGINIGNDVDTVPINIGTGAASKTITIGNLTGSTGVNTNAGTNGITLSTGSSSGDIILGNTGSGDIHIGNDVGTGQINVGTGNSVRAVVIGSTNTTSTTVIHSGTFGLTIGNDFNSGEIQIGNVNQAKTIIIGNTAGGSRTIHRNGTGGFIRSQSTHVSLSDGAATLTIAQLLNPGLLSGTPTTDRTLTLPTAALAVAGISGVAIGDCIDFVFINKATDEFKWNIAMGSGGTAEGNMEVWAPTDSGATYRNSGSATFRLRFTNITAESEAYTIYRIS